jgi:hypothetical protein
MELFELVTEVTDTVADLVAWGLPLLPLAAVMLVIGVAVTVRWGRQ